MDIRTERWKGRWIEGWNGPMDGQMDVYMVGLMDG